MKRLGIIIIGIGFILTVITSVNFATREKVADIGELKITRTKSHPIAWSPFTGIVTMAIGGAILLIGKNKK
jgi:hypothetical protein